MTSPYWELTRDGIPLRLGRRWLLSAPDPTAEHPHPFACWPGCLVLARHASRVFYINVNPAYQHPGVLVDGASLGLPFRPRRKIDKAARRALKVEISKARTHWQQWEADNSPGPLYRPWHQRISDYVRHRHHGLAHTVLASETSIEGGGSGASTAQYARQTMLQVVMPNTVSETLLQPGHKLVAWAKVDPTLAVCAGGWFHRVWYVRFASGLPDWHDGFSRPSGDEKDYLADVKALRPGIPSREYDFRHLPEIESYMVEALDRTKFNYHNQQRIRLRRGISNA